MLAVFDQSYVTPLCFPIAKLDIPTFVQVPDVLLHVSL